MPRLAVFGAVGTSLLHRASGGGVRASRTEGVFSYFVPSPHSGHTPPFNPTSEYPHPTQPPSLLFRRREGFQIKIPDINTVNNAG
ncbi:MAG: hypothetical protein ACSHX5_08500 [Phycisphaerales bacterium]